MKTILVIEHRHNPEPDAGLQHLADRGCNVKCIRPFAGEALPDPEPADGVILMGGPQMVTELDHAPYLADEMEFAMDIMARGTPLLAICLGAQLVAHRLGAVIDWHRDGAVGFGFHNITPLPKAKSLFPPGLRVLSGNAQGFTLPGSAELLARGEVWPNQAFKVGDHVLAFQFHPEVTRGILDDWQLRMAEYVNRPGADDFATQNADFELYDGQLKAWYRNLLDEFFGLGQSEE